MVAQSLEDGGVTGHESPHAAGTAKIPTRDSDLQLAGHLYVREQVAEHGMGRMEQFREEEAQPCRCCDALDLSADLVTVSL